MYYFYLISHCQCHLKYEPGTLWWCNNTCTYTFDVNTLINRCISFLKDCSFKNFKWLFNRKLLSLYLDQEEMKIVNAVEDIKLYSLFSLQTLLLISCMVKLKRNAMDHWITYLECLLASHSVQNIKSYNVKIICTFC